MDAKKQAREARQRFWFGLVVAVGLVGLGVVHEEARTGRAIRRIVHQYLHASLRRAEKEEVVIVDLSELKPEPGRLGYPVTSRAFLRDVVNELVQQRPPPRCIVIDVDFSAEMEDGLSVATRDPELLHSWRNLDVPVIVGVGRQSSSGRDGWLGPGLSGMAGGIHIADEDRAIAPLWIREGPADALWSLSAAAVRAVTTLPVVSERITRMDTHTAAAEGVEWKTFLVDCSGVDALEERRIPVRSLVDVMEPANHRKDPEFREGIGGKIVVLGMASPAHSLDNSFTVPGRSRPYPGVYLHACAIETLLRGYLLEPKRTVRVAIDLALALLLLAGVTWIGRAGKNWFGEIRLNLFAGAVALAIGLGWAYVSRILWDGFVWIALALALHRFIDRAREEAKLGGVAKVAGGLAVLGLGAWFFLRTPGGRIEVHGEDRAGARSFQVPLEERMSVRPAGAPRGSEEKHAEALGAAKRRRWSEAARLLEDVLREDACHPTARMDLAGVLLDWARSARTSERLQAAEAAVRACSDGADVDPLYSFHLACLRMLQGESDEALAALRRAVERGGEEIRVRAREDLFFLDLRDDERFLELTSEKWQAQAALPLPSRR